MESAIDRLRKVVSLTKVWVPPHTRMLDGKIVYVDGYWREAPEGAYIDLMGGEHLPSSSATPMQASPDFEEVPLFEEPKPPAPEPSLHVSIPTDDYVEVIPKVFMKDKRAQGENTPPMLVNPDSLQRQIDIVGIDMSQVDEIKIRLTDQSPSGGDQGVTQQISPSKYAIGVAVAHKPEFKEHHMYVTNNSLIHELRHITQHQNNPNMSAEYMGFNQSVGYAYNPYEFDARLYGHIADPRQRKALPEGTDYVDPEESFALRTDVGDNGKGVPTPPEKVAQIEAAPAQPPVKTGAKLADMPTGDEAYAAANPGHTPPGGGSPKPSQPSSSADALMGVISQLMGGGAVATPQPMEDLPGMPGEAKFHSAIVAAAKTVNVHAEDGEYNEATMDNLYQVQADIVNGLKDLKSKDGGPYFVGQETVDFGDDIQDPDAKAAKQQYIEMLQFYLAQIEVILDAKMAGMKTYANLPEGTSKKLPRFAPEKPSARLADLAGPFKEGDRVMTPDGPATIQKQFGIGSSWWSVVMDDGTVAEYTIDQLGTLN